MSTLSDPILTEDTINQNLKNMEFPWPSPVVSRGNNIEKEILRGKKFPFADVIHAHAGDPQGMGQKPITFFQQTVSLCIHPELMADNRFGTDVKQRAKTILENCKGHSIGSYSESAGMEVIRRQVASYVEQRDGVPSNYEDVFLSSGATDAVRLILFLLNNGTSEKPPGVMIPIPQYPLFSSTVAEYGMYQISYYLDEEKQWALDVNELRRAINESRDYCDPMALVVINPGNPSGFVFSRDDIEDIVKFAYEENLFILADEVYQYNVYDSALQFYSFKKIMYEMGPPYDEMELASFMSGSKGYMGECGARSGYCEVINLDPLVKEMLMKLLTSKMCPSLLGQIIMYCITNPPRPDEPSHNLFVKQKTDILQSLKERAEFCYQELNSVKGLSCNKVVGAMYVYPRIHLPPKALQEAQNKDQSPDEFYAMEMLEEAGICVIPGCLFGQMPGTYHFRAKMEQPADASIEDTREKLDHLWTVMGFNAEEKKERVDIFYNYVSNMLSQLYQEEVDQYEMLKAMIKSSQKEVDELCWELGMSSDKFSPPGQNLLPLQMKECLSSQMNTLKKEKISREKALNALREAERPLCSLLDMPSLQLSTSTGVPTKQDLLELEEHIKMLEMEKGYRMKEYHSFKRELTTIMEETEYLPDTSFGSDLFFGEDKNVILSQRNIKELKDLVEKAYHKKCEMERELESLRERLQTLWDRLNIEEQDRTTFLSNHSGCKMSVINAFEREIQKCEELKKKNIGKYIIKMRSELVDAWDKCYISQEERESFKYFHYDDFSESLLDIHDAEVQKLNDYYKENENVFTKINRRNQLWDNMILFEKKASDPNRFNNRGGQLLQEEKERNRLLKELPRLEAEIFESILQYEEKSGKKFLVNGEEFEKVVEAQRNKHLEEREKEKLERRQRALQNDGKSFANSSNNTPAKRQLNTPSMTPSKFRRMNTGMSALKVPGSVSKAGISMSPRTLAFKTPKNRSRVLRQSPRTVPRRKNPTIARELLMGNENEAPRSATGHNSRNFVESISTYSEFTESLKSHREGLMNSTETQIPAETVNFNV